MTFNRKHLSLANMLACLIFLMACSTGGNHRLDQSLQHYGGQIADQVRSQLDLNKWDLRPRKNRLRQQNCSATPLFVI
nr:hypothetical protein [Acinetobacter terrestris]